ncbi:MAG TPA: hypothetical protein PKW95_15010 [bacterium]|nr:hypothetical protein [bacterium]
MSRNVLYGLLMLILAVGLACDSGDDDDNDAASPDDDAADDDNPVADDDVNPPDDDTPDDDTTDDDTLDDDDDDTTPIDDDDDQCELTTLCDFAVNECDNWYTSWHNVDLCLNHFADGCADADAYVECVCSCHDDESSCSNWAFNCQWICRQQFCTEPAGDDDDDDDDFEFIAPLSIQDLAGGKPGDRGSSVVVTPDGHTLVSVRRGRKLIVFDVDDDADPEVVAPIALDQEMVLDGEGLPHLAFYDATTHAVTYAVKTKDGWTTQIVEDAGWWSDTNGFPMFDQLDLTIDAVGAAHLCYYRLPGGDLRYATNAGGTWVAESVDAAGDVGRYCSLAVAADGDVWIAYSDITLGRLKAACGRAGSWDIGVVDPFSMGRDISMALAPDGAVVLGYVSGIYHETVTGLLANNRDGLWRIHRVNEPGSVYSASMVLDDSGNAYLATGSRYNLGLYGYLDYIALNIEGQAFPVYLSEYGVQGLSLTLDDENYVLISHGNSNGDIALTDNISGSWNSVIVDEAPGVTNTNMVRDALGVIHVVYQSKERANSSDDDDIIYANNRFGEWQSVVVQENRWCSNIALAVNADGLASVAYSYQNQLFFAADTGDGWQSETVPTPLISVSVYVDLALDSDGHAHIAFYDNNDPLYHATNAGGDWLVEPVTADNVNLGTYLAIAVDDAAVHMLARDESTDDLLYVTNASGEWTSTVLNDEAHSAGDIITDETGAVHLTYYDYDLHYVTNSSGEWVSETIDDGGYLSQIFFDSAGLPHVIYVDIVDFDLWHAVRREGTWRRDRLDWGGVAGISPTGFIDDAGRVHAFYEAEDAAVYGIFPVANP